MVITSSYGHNYTNVHVWSWKMGYLTSEKKKPTGEDLTYETWDVENSIVLVWLVNSLEEEISSYYMCYFTTNEL
ncbi:hypothetical protein CsatB_029189 [Cannabis sativa]